MKELLCESVGAYRNSQGDAVDEGEDGDVGVDVSGVHASLAAKAQKATER